MKRFLGAFFLSLATLATLTSPARAAGLPVIVKVTLDALTFTTQSASGTQIVARFPNANPVSGFVPGTYFLAVQFSN